MSIDKNTLQDDLAFMRALVEETGPMDRSTGIVYGAGGLTYGLQCLINWALLAGEVQAGTFVWLTLGILPTVIFISINAFFVWSNRGAPLPKGATQRALQAMFAGGGIAITLLAMVFGWQAFQREDWSIWFLFPVMVAAFQGAIWFAAMIIRRRKWHGVTALGWFISAIALGLLTNDAVNYVGTLGVVLVLCMGVPGYLMIVKSKTESDA